MPSSVYIIKNTVTGIFRFVVQYCVHMHTELWPRVCAAVNPNNKSTFFRLVMPIPYSLYLQWRMIWIAHPWHASPQDMGQQLSVSEQTVRRYFKMFEEWTTSSIQQIWATDAAKANSWKSWHLPTRDSTTTMCRCQCFYNLYNPEIYGV